MRSLLTVLLLSLVFFGAGAQPLLKDRIGRYPLSANQSFLFDTVRGQLSLVTLVNPEQLQNQDSFFVEAKNQVIPLRRYVVAGDYEVIRELQIIYVNRFDYSLSEAFVFRFKVTAGRVGAAGKEETIPGIDEHVRMGKPENADSVGAVKFYKRAYKSGLSSDEFLLKGDYPEGSTLELFRNVDLGDMVPDLDSLKAVSTDLARALFLDLIREDCADFIRVSVTYQDRHFPERSIGWTYQLRGCDFDDTPRWVGRVSIEPTVTQTSVNHEK